MKLMEIPSFIPQKYHHEIKCLLGEQHRQAIIHVLTEMELGDNAYLKIANMLPGMEKCPIGVLEILAKKLNNDVSRRVLAIRKGQIA